MTRARKLPALKSLMAKDKPRAQTWQEQMAVMEQWSQSHNRRLIERGNDNG